MEIRILDKNRIDDVIALVASVSGQYVINDFDDFGKINFTTVNSYDFYMQNDVMTYVALDGEKIVGMVSYRQQHICLLFVDEKYHHQGIASQLIKVVEDLTIGNIDVHASDYAIPFYQKIGFEKVEQRQKKDGIVYTPMLKKRSDNKRFANYNDVCQFIAHQKDRVYSLDNFKRFMNDMHDPQLKLNCVHIGGTNGKGSTTNYIKEVLKRSGYRVATFTSPAMYSRLDIIRINDQIIDDQTMVKYANRYVDLWLEYEISMFEIEVFIAIMYFIDKGVDLAIFEVGLGGELDATNIIQPLVALNTNIGLDHTEYLGNSYESIAKTKAGIVKDGIDYITGEHKQECLDIFREICDQHHSSLITLDRIHDKQDGQNVKYSYKGYNIVLDTPAWYQIDNSALALETLIYLRDHGYYQYSDDGLIEGMFHAKWSGRFEIVHEKPLIIIDGAHNKEGIDAFYQCAKKYPDIKIIFSALKDKDTHHMIEKLLELTHDITICEFKHKRQAKAQDLAESFPVKIEPDFKKAVDDAYLHQGTVFITGSLYFISQVRQYIMEKRGDKK